MALGLRLIVCAALSSIVACSLEELAQRSAEHLKSQTGEGLSFFKDLLEINDDNRLVAKPRQKRLAELPHGTFFQVKWNIDIPYKTGTRFNTFLQIATLSNINYPAEYLHDTATPTFYELLKPEFQDYINDQYTPDSAYERQTILHRHKRAAQQERHAVYSLMEDFINYLGLPPRQCLLRTVCEVAETPFDDDDLLGVLMNAILSPSLGGADTLNYDYLDFLGAEQHGRVNGSCEVKYNECPKSVFGALPFLQEQMVFK